MKTRIHRIFSKNAHVCWKSDETKWLSDSHFVLNGIFKNNAITFAYFPKTRWLLDLHSPLKKFLHVCWKSDEIQDSSDFQQTCACLLKIRWNQVIIRPSLINHEGKKSLQNPQINLIINTKINFQVRRFYLLAKEVENNDISISKNFQKIITIHSQKKFESDHNAIIANVKHSELKFENKVKHGG